MTHATPLLLLPLVLAALGGGPEAPVTPDGLDVPFAVLPFSCNDCSSCGLNQHTVHTSPIGEGLWDAALHNCQSHGGCDSHQRCFYEDDGLVEASTPERDAELGGIAEQLRRAIVGRDVSAIRSVMSLPEVTWNSGRHAAQVVGCGGLVLAHFPLPLDLAELLE